jgi:uncharacterized membrane protein
MLMSQSNARPVLHFLRIFYGLLFIASGVSHFVIPDFYESIVPEFVPQAKLLVVITGIVEILLGALFAYKPTARYAGWAFIVYLIAMFPVNVLMALHPDRFPQFAPLGLWLRLPLQTLLITGAYFLSRNKSIALETA